MKQLSKSKKIYFVLILILAICASVSIYLPYSGMLEMGELPASKPIMAAVSFLVVFILYGGFGLIGLKLSKKLGFPDLWDKNINNKQRLLLPLIGGVIIGFIFIVSDQIFSAAFGIGTIPHPDFPFSIIASISAGIGEELMFRLFFISFWVWLISKIILRGRWQNGIFWIIAVLSGLLFAAGHIPSVLVIYGFENVTQIPAALLAEIFILNTALSLPAAYYFRKYGILAAMGLHLWTDIFWHVIYGAF